MLGFGEAIASLGAALGKPALRHQSIDVEEWCASGAPPPLQELLRYMVAEQAAAVPFVQRDVAAMESLLGRPLTTLPQWAAEHQQLFA